MTLQSKLITFKNELSQVFLEREVTIQLVLTALACRQNGFLGGPPGTAKSDILRKICSAFDGKSFYYLMGRTTTPDDIIGAIDPIAFKDGKFIKNLSNRSADSHIVTLDEIWKANPITLNAILGLMLDKVITNGDQLVNVPLISLFGASNEWGEADSMVSMDAFKDRLLVRTWVGGISRKSNLTLQKRKVGLIPTPEITTKFSLKDLNKMYQESQRVSIREDILEALQDIYEAIADPSAFAQKPAIVTNTSLSQQLQSAVPIEVSTRRQLQIIDLLKAYAWVNGDDVVDYPHLAVLEHSLWNQPKDAIWLRAVIRNSAEAETAKALEIVERITMLVNATPSKPDTENVSTYLTQLSSVLSELENASEMLVEIMQTARDRSRIESLIRKVDEHQKTVLSYTKQATGI